MCISHAKDAKHAPDPEVMRAFVSPDSSLTYISMALKIHIEI